jgi:hypothetical protein
VGVSRATNRGKRLPFTFLVSSPESANQKLNVLPFVRIHSTVMRFIRHVDIDYEPEVAHVTP